MCCNVYIVLHWILLVISLVMSLSLLILLRALILPQIRTNEEAVADIQVKVQTLMNTVTRTDEQLLLQPNVNHKYHHDGGANFDEELEQSINNYLTELNETITRL